MIPISQEESFLIRKKYPDVKISGSSKTHKSRAKRYFMTETKPALRELAETNVAAKESLLDSLRNELRNCHNPKKSESIKKEIEKLESIGR